MEKLLRRHHLIFSCFNKDERVPIPELRKRIAEKTDENCDPVLEWMVEASLLEVSGKIWQVHLIDENFLKISTEGDLRFKELDDQLEQEGKERNNTRWIIALAAIAAITGLIAIIPVIHDWIWPKK